MKTTNLRDRSLSLVLFVLLFALVNTVYFPNKAEAAVVSMLATPSTTAYADATGVNLSGVENFVDTIPSNGIWTTTSTTPTSEGRHASYDLPNIATCDAALITVLEISIINITGNTAPASDRYSGISSYVANKYTSDFLRIKTVISGTRLDGPSSLILGGPKYRNVITRGINDDDFTGPGADIPINGDIHYELNTSTLTARDYRDLSIQVQHDILDGPFGYITSISSPQPLVTVEYDNSPCSPTTNTGLKPENNLQNFVLILSSITFLWMSKIYAQRTKNTK